jgi:hypothetical protein
MRFIMIAALLATAAVGAAPFSAGKAAPAKTAPAHPPEASIPFANNRGIWDWRATDDHTLYVQDIHRAWYKATLFAPCINLPFAQTVGFRTGPLDTFDRYSTVLVEGQRCTLTSVVRADPPPGEGHRKKG